VLFIMLEFALPVAMVETLPQVQVQDEVANRDGRNQ
jgi:hypothetical protein